MRVGLFSDVHGNAVAFEAMLADAAQQRLDQLVCLGDHVQGGGQPAEALERLRELECPIVLGNADYEVLFPQRKLEEWTAGQLTPAQLEFIRAFERTVTVDLGDGARVVCFHGSPRSFEDVVLPETPIDDLRATLDGHAGAVFAGGHVHLQWMRRFDASLWLCVGSVGLAYAHGQPDDNVRLDPWSEYAIVSHDGERLAVEFRRTPFDVAAYVRALEESGRPGADEVVRALAPR